MIPTTPPQRQVLQGPHYGSWGRLEIQDKAGRWRNMAPWFQNATWGTRLDEPIPSWSAALGRDSITDGSLAPQMRDRIYIGRRARLFVATVPELERPDRGDWQLAVDGIIDRIDAGGDPMTVTGRGTGWQTGDRWIKEAREYGQKTGQPIGGVMRAILDDWSTAVDLAIPDPPPFVVRRYEQQPMVVQEALQQLATLIGWVVRPHWHEPSGEFRLHFVDPERERTRTQWTLGPDDYFDVTQLDLDRFKIRNSVRVRYRGPNDDEVQIVNATIPESIEAFDELWMEFVMGSDSPIDTDEEARRLARAALSDLAFPEAEQTITTKFLWPIEVGDLLRFEPNGVHYDKPQRWAVVAVSHDLAADRTQITVRGKPAGNYRAWRAVFREDPKDFKDPDPFGHIEILWVLTLEGTTFQAVAWFNFYGNIATRSFRWAASKRSGSGGPPEEASNLVNRREVERMDTGVGPLNYDFTEPVEGEGDTVWLLVRGYSKENAEGVEGKRIIFQRDLQRETGAAVRARQDRLRRYAEVARRQKGAPSVVTETMIPQDFK